MYVVTKTHNFDGETEAAIFESYGDAFDYLQWIWREYYDAEIAEGSTMSEYDCFCSAEEEYAKVEWADGCRTEFHMIEVLEPRTEYRKQKNQQSGFAKGETTNG